MARYRIGDPRQDSALPWRVIDTHFGNQVVAAFRSHCLARELVRALNEPYFRPPPPRAGLTAGGRSDGPV